MAHGSSRPLSPHLEVYRLHETMVMSGLHRITGFCLVIGTFLLTWWLVAAGLGEAQFAVVQGVLHTWIGKLALFGWTFSLFYHLCNGIRHLVWDMGLSFEIRNMVVGGWFMAATAAGLTVLTWLVIFVELSF